MKYILFLFLTINCFGSFDRKFHEDTIQMEQSLEELSKQEGITSYFLKRKIKKIMHRYMNEEKNSVVIADEFLKHVMNDGGFQKEGYQEYNWNIIIEFLKKIYNSEIVQFVMKASGIQELKDRSTGIWDGYLMVLQPELCRDGILKLAEDMAYMTAFISILYYFQNNPGALLLANIGGTIGAMAGKIVVHVTELDYFVCSKIHRRKYEIFSNDFSFSRL